MADLTCSEHGTKTKLTCVTCGNAICPKCSTRSAVGLKCRTCGGSTEKSFAASPNRARLGVVVVPLVLLAAFVLLPRLSGGTDKGAAVDEQVGEASLTQQVALGETASDGPLELTAESFRCGSKELGSGANKTTAQGRYCLLSVRARNSGQVPESLIPPLQLLVDSTQRSFAPDDRATAVNPENPARSSLLRVNPGSEGRIVFAYDLPEDSTADIVRLRRSSRTFGVTVRLAARPS